VDGCTWAILQNFPTFFVYELTHFYSEQRFLPVVHTHSRSKIYLYFQNCFAFRREKALVDKESQMQIFKSKYYVYVIRLWNLYCLPFCRPSVAMAWLTYNCVFCPFNYSIYKSHGIIVDLLQSFVSITLSTLFYLSVTYNVTNGVVWINCQQINIPTALNRFPSEHQTGTYTCWCCGAKQRELNKVY
jgi:hypothetical protein